MPEPVCMEHVKRNRVRMPPRTVAESELCLGIDIAQYQPRGSDAIYARLGTCDPSSAKIVFNIVLPYPFPVSLIDAFELAQSFFDSGAYRTTEEIDFSDLL